MSGPFTQGAGDDKIAVTNGINCHEHPCHIRKLIGKPVSKGHLNDLAYLSIALTITL